MTVKQVLAKVVDNAEIIPGHKVIVCSAPEIASVAEPGHFVNVLASATYESILRKPFSIFKSDPQSGLISILYQLIGATTIGMGRKMPGDELDLVGPLGGRVFTLDPRADAIHIMVGGGYGVPPLVFLAERLRRQRPAAQIIFLVGARRKELLLCEAELLQLNVHVAPSTEDGSHGRAGLVTDVLRDHLSPAAAVYCCGPTGMMRAVGELAAVAGAPCQVSVEVPMPCGVGVCMGCVLDITDGRRVRSCTEGPVFYAGEVIWK